MSLWLGGEGGMETELVQRAGVPFAAIPAAGVHGVGLRRLPGNLVQVGRGLLAARRALASFRPEVILTTGGFVTFPVAVAARFISPRPRLLLYTPDIEPGLALKSVAWLADRVAVTALESTAYYPRRQDCVVTGYPVRPELARWTRQSGRQALGLHPDEPALLVFGGSKGARSLNQALLAILPQALELAQVIHISGSLDWPAVDAARQALPAGLQKQYFAYPYLHEEMGAALAAADLAVARAGAASLGEYPFFGCPAVLVPYPHAWRYQKVNAGYLVKHGAALALQDEALSAELLPALRGLFAEPARLEAMRAAMRRLAAPDAANRIAAELASLASPNE